MPKACFQMRRNLSTSSYQNVDEPDEPVVEVVEAEVIDIPPMSTPRPAASQPSNAGMYSPPPAQPTQTGGRNRGCLIACVVTAIIFVCCLIATAAILALSWNFVVDILNNMGFYY